MPLTAAEGQVYSQQEKQEKQQADEPQEHRALSVLLVLSLAEEKAR